MSLKFGLSEKHTKFEKNLPYGFDKSADLLSKLQNHEKDFFQIMCASQKVRTLNSPSILLNILGAINLPLPPVPRALPPNGRFSFWPNEHFL